jgi:hypothetical protein
MADSPVLACMTDLVTFTLPVIEKPSISSFFRHERTHLGVTLILTINFSLLPMPMAYFNGFCYNAGRQGGNQNYL